MVKPRTWTCLLAIHNCFATSAPDNDDFLKSLDAGINLLQLRASSQSISNSSSGAVRLHGDPGASERAMCPHEIEAELDLQGDKRFGCKGTLRARDTVKCSIWGEPHMTEFFGDRPGSHSHESTSPISDVLYKIGLLRLAAAKDGSWEVQLFNCGIFAGALAARIGKSIVEVFVDGDGQLRYLLNGAEVPSLPAEGPHGVKLDSTHRSITTDTAGNPRAGEHFPGTCVDDPGGQINIDLAQDITPASRDHNGEIQGNSGGNLNVKLEAAIDSVTAAADDKYSLCNLAGAAVWRVSDWEVHNVAPEDSLFTIGNQMCSGCNGHLGWDKPGGRIADVETHKIACDAAVPKDHKQITLESICQNAKIAIADAAQACDALKDRLEFFKDCQIDFCFSGGQVMPALEAIAEEASENPQPRCIGEECDPSSKCCNALRDQAILTLDNVVSNEMCNGGELRYGSALTQNGEVIDLVVAPVGDFECSGQLDDTKFGSKNSEIGVLAILAGAEQAFEFRFVKHGTDTDASPKNLMMTFLDIDQGKNGKQRESVEVCGGGSAVTTDDTELDIQTKGDCIKVISTTAGTGADNPDSIEGMSQLQRARTAAFEVTGSTFTATLGVSKKGRNPRRFNFAGHPSVSCVLK